MQPKRQTRSSTLMELEMLKRKKSSALMKLRKFKLKNALLELEKMKVENENLKKEKDIIKKSLCLARKEKKELENKSEVVKRLRCFEMEVNYLDRLVCAQGGELTRINTEIENCNVCKQHMTPM